MNGPPPDYLDGRYVVDPETGCWLPPDGAAPFAYSDGAEVERALLESVRACADRSVLSAELRARIHDWPTRYHLGARRANLLRPIEAILPEARVLEIGAGCGAISRFLGESGARLTALEGSLARARVAAERCRGLDNVAVLVDGFDRLPVAPEFDLVCLIGVLEYARLFFPAESGDPIDAMLRHARRFLRPGGRLLLALENQLGLKYFAGFREDHLDQVMLGVEDRYRADGAVTFGKAELARRLRAAGYADQEWLYPFPDYKLPVSVFNEAALASDSVLDCSAMVAGTVVADGQKPEAYRFSLELAWATVCRNGLAGHLANSFLVLAAESGSPVLGADILAHHYAAERRPGYTKALTFRRGDADVFVEARPLATGAVPADVALRLDDADYKTGEHGQMALIRLLNEPGWRAEDLVPWARRWLDAVLAESGLDSVPGLDARLPGRLADAVPRNLIGAEAEAGFIDLEWDMVEGIRLGHLLFRGIVFSLLAVSSVAPPASGTPLAPLRLLESISAALGLAMTAADIESAFADEARFQDAVTGLCWAGFAALDEYRLPVRGAGVETKLPPVEAPAADPGRPAPGWRARLAGLLGRADPDAS